MLKNRLNIESKRDPNFWDKNLGEWDRMKYGFNEVYPNSYYNQLIGKFPYMFSLINVMNRSLENDFEVSSSPRNF